MSVWRILLSKRNGKQKKSLVQAISSLNEKRPLIENLFSSSSFASSFVSFFDALPELNLSSSVGGMILRVEKKEAKEAWKISP